MAAMTSASTTSTPNDTVNTVFRVTCEGAISRFGAGASGVTGLRLRYSVGSGAYGGAETSVPQREFSRGRGARRGAGERFRSRLRVLTSTAGGTYGDGAGGGADTTAGDRARGAPVSRASVAARVAARDSLRGYASGAQGDRARAHGAARGRAHRGHRGRLPERRVRGRRPGGDPLVGDADPGAGARDAGLGRRADRERRRTAGQRRHRVGRLEIPCARAAGKHAPGAEGRPPLDEKALRMMGTRSNGHGGAKSAHGADSESARLRADIDATPQRLEGLLGELDRRRREAFDVRLQMRRHPVAFAFAAALALGAVG